MSRVGTTTASARASLPAVSLPMSASPSGAVVVCRCKRFGFGNNGRVDVYLLKAREADCVPLVSFTPYPDESGHGKPEDVRFAAALSDTRVLTCDLRGRLTAWDVAAGSVRAVWQADVGPDMHFGGDDTYDLAVSPGGKWVAAAARGMVTFVDVATGRVMGQIPTADKKGLFDLGWSPSGRTVMARGDGDTLVILDVAAGKVVRTVQVAEGNRVYHAFGDFVSFGGGGGGGRLSCPDDGFALLGGGLLVDATTGATVPAYDPPLAGGTVLAATGPGVTLLAGDGRLVATHVPTEAVRAEAASGADLALKPGMSVALDESLDGLSDADRQAIDAAVRKRLADNGFVLAASADTTVVVRTEPGQPHEALLWQDERHVPDDDAAGQRDVDDHHGEGDAGHDPAEGRDDLGAEAGVGAGVPRPDQGRAVDGGRGQGDRDLRPEVPGERRDPGVHRQARRRRLWCSTGRSGGTALGRERRSHRQTRWSDLACIEARSRVAS